MYRGCAACSCSLNVYVLSIASKNSTLLQLLVQSWSGWATRVLAGKQSLGIYLFPSSAKCVYQNTCFRERRTRLCLSSYTSGKGSEHPFSQKKTFMKASKKKRILFDSEKVSEIYRHLFRGIDVLFPRTAFVVYLLYGGIIALYPE